MAEKNSIRLEINQCIKEWAGCNPDNIVALPETASNRKYFRCTIHNKTVVAAYAEDQKENHAFIYLSGHLRKHLVNVPEIFYEKLDKNIYLIEDLGDTTLFDFVHKDNTDNSRINPDIYKKVIDQMPFIQIEAAKDMDFSICYPRAEFDYQSMLWDLNYFKYYFLKLINIHYNEQDIEKDFQKLINFLLQTNRNFFLFRDFQSRNIMIKEKKVFFIDYQGGRKGALQYDLASLLYEPKADLSPELRDELYDYYLEVFSKIKEFNRKDFERYFPGYVLIRMLQAMGAYGFRGYFERKTYFLQSIPFAIKAMKYLLQKTQFEVEISHLLYCLKKITETDLVNEFSEKSDKLTIRISSFSYKGNIPNDYSGNGGGFVFDCRALPNPGREDRFKNQNGKDPDVIQYLEDNPEIITFIHSSYLIIKQTITNYIQRKFNNLMINFGCTGGQHRSVYCAEKIAEKIKTDFDLDVVIKHLQIE